MEVSSQRGVTLIELVVALSVFVVGLLAVAKMQLLSIGSDQLTNMRSLAISEVNNLAEEILSKGKKPLTEDKMNQWQANIARHLPLGLAKVEHSQHNYTIEVSWYTDVPTTHSDCQFINNPLRQCVHVNVKD